MIYSLVIRFEYVLIYTGILLWLYTNVGSEVCKCRCRMSTGFPENADRNVENILIYHSHKKDAKGHELRFEHIRTV